VDHRVEQFGSREDADIYFRRAMEVQRSAAASMPSRAGLGSPPFVPKVGPSTAPVAYRRAIFFPDKA
jgi:hypothetical protein